MTLPSNVTYLITCCCQDNFIQRLLGSTFSQLLSLLENHIVSPACTPLFCSSLLLWSPPGKVVLTHRSHVAGILCCTLGSRLKTICSALLPRHCLYHSVQLLCYCQFFHLVRFTVIKELGPPRRPHYSYRSSWWKFFYLWTCSNIPTLWSATQIVAPRTCHQSIVSDWKRSHTASGKDLSLLLPSQRLVAPSRIKVELWNAQSITNKSCLIHDHLLDKCLDFMCISETWHKPDTFSSFHHLWRYEHPRGHPLLPFCCWNPAITGLLQFKATYWSPPTQPWTWWLQTVPLSPNCWYIT